MIHLNQINNSISFQKKDKNKTTTNNILPAALLILSLNTGSPINADTFVKNDTIETVSNPLKSDLRDNIYGTNGMDVAFNVVNEALKNDDEPDSVNSKSEDKLVTNLNNISNPTRLTDEELMAAPSPKVNIAGKDKLVGIVVDTKTNKLYRYDESGEVIDGYHVATGKLNRYGKSLTDTGIRRVHHIENYPYKSAPGTKRSRNPKAYGPNVLYLTTINSKTGNEEGSNGEFIHGNNDASSIGTYASKGCIRMDNDVIKIFAKEVQKGTLVLIK